MCAALLNPSSAEPLVWPSPLKFISELNQEAKALLECALMEANREREKNILMEANREREKNILKGSGHSLPSPSHSADGTDYNISEVISMLICTYGINIFFFHFLSADGTDLGIHFLFFFLQFPALAKLGTRVADGLTL
jgi:hypothetical protein